MEQLQALAKTLEAKLEFNTGETTNREQDADAAVSMALFEYRRGKFAVAQSWVRESLDIIRSSKSRITTAHAIGAMATWKLGQPELAKAREQAERLQACVAELEKRLSTTRKHGLSLMDAIKSAFAGQPLDFAPE